MRIELEADGQPFCGQFIHRDYLRYKMFGRYRLKKKKIIAYFTFYWWLRKEIQNAWLI